MRAIIEAIGITCKTHQIMNIDGGFYTNGNIQPPIFFKKTSNGYLKFSSFFGNSKIMRNFAAQSGGFVLAVSLAFGLISKSITNK